MAKNVKTCICGKTEIMWNTRRVGVTADNIDEQFHLLQYYNTLCLNSDCDQTAELKWHLFLFFTLIDFSVVV